MLYSKIYKSKHSQMLPFNGNTNYLLIVMLQPPRNVLATKKFLALKKV